MSDILNILNIEDSAKDAKLIERELTKAGYEVTLKRVETATEMEKALGDGEWDVVIADYALPSFNGLEALNILKQSGYDIPFILVSGAIGEEIAVLLMRNGAHDYVMKDNLARLAPAVKRELRYAKARKERKQTEDALEESEMRFRNMAQAANDAIVVADSEGNIISWNRAATAIFGHTQEEALQKPVTILMPDRFKKRHLNAIAQFKSTGEPTVIGTRAEVIGLRKNGDEFPLELSLASWQTETALYFSAVIHDITERKKTEENLRKLNNSLEYASDIVVITDTKGTIEYVNKAVKRVTGYTQQELIGENTRIFRSGDHDESFYMSIWKVIKSGNVWKGEMINKKKTGETYEEEMTIAPVLDENEKIINFVFIKRDISKEKLLDKQLRQSYKKLQKTMAELQGAQSQLIRSEKLASLGALSAGVAHEIKNPLNIISTSAQLMLGKTGEDEYFLKKCKMIIEQTERAAKITDNLRDFARERKPEISSVRLHDLIDKSLALVEYEMKIENINVDKAYYEKEIIFYADKDQLSQVFLNIIGNARDSMNERQKLYSYEELQEMGWTGILLVTTSLDASIASITFSDTGLGMPEKVVGKVFDPFFTTKEEGKGTGLGMSISYGIIENHNGTLSVESIEGKGSKFHLKLPINLEDAGTGG